MATGSRSTRLDDLPFASGFTTSRSGSKRNSPEEFAADTAVQHRKWLEVG